MIVFIIACIISAVITLILKHKYWDGDPDSLLLSSIAFIVLLIVSICITVIPIGDTITSEELIDTKELRALNDKTALEGKFRGNIFVTNGYINSVPIYAFYYTTNDNVVKYGQIDATATDIYIISENETPKLETYTITYKQSKLLFWPSLEAIKKIEHYKLYIPDNAIISDVALDLK